MSDANSKRAVAYLRVSSISQVDGHSLNAQERLFNQLCESRGWAAVRVYREEGQSAHSESVKKRPIFRQLMEDARRDQFDIVVVHTLDRWSRNLRVTLESLANLAMHNVALVSITENIDYSTPEGMLTTQLLGSFAQFFSNMLGTHVSKGLDRNELAAQVNSLFRHDYVPPTALRVKKEVLLVRPILRPVVAKRQGVTLFELHVD
jgi:site-specific DNA recombinase